MQVLGAPGASLTYCTNIHPGESWSEVRETLETDVRAVKARIAPSSPFGVGLRLSALACSELRANDELSTLGASLASAGLYVFTLNGFPYGQFHGTRVKERVYRPDWLEEQRVEYTAALAHILASLVPAGQVGSISTVPGCFKPRAAAPGSDVIIAQNLVRVAGELVRLERETGKQLCLALEPEPACAIETTDEALAFFENALFHRERLAELTRLTGVAPGAAESLLRRHVGVCLDACHAAVQFERPLDALRRLAGAGLRIPKIQVSAGLSLNRFDPEALAVLESFADATYLHQVVARTPHGLERFVDIAPALARANRSPGTEWRVHFHVPVFQRELGPFSSTQQDLAELLRARETLDVVPHLEVETYTFELLPEAYKPSSLIEAIARELAWTAAELQGRVQPES